MFVSRKRNRFRILLTISVIIGMYNSWLNATPEKNDNRLKLILPIKHTHSVIEVLFNYDGTTLASGSLDGTIKLWNITTGKEIGRLLHGKGISCVAFSPDGKILASGSLDHNSVMLWDVATGEKITHLDSHSKGISCVAFSPDGKILASGSLDYNAVTLWDIATGEKITYLDGHSKGISCVAFSLDGKALASGSLDHNIKLWDMLTQKETYSFIEHKATAISLAFSPNEKLLISGDLAWSLRIWNLSRKNNIRIFTGRPFFSAALSPDGKILASVVDTWIIFYDVLTGNEIYSILKWTSILTTVAFSLDGKILASGDAEGNVILWNMDRNNDK